MRSACLAVLVALLLAAPAFGQDAGSGSDDAARQSQTITMYGHVFNNGFDAPQPANTYAPEGDELTAFWNDDNCGVLPVDDPTVGVPVYGGFAPGGPDCDTDAINKLVIFLTAGPVQVHSSNDFNDTATFYSLLHNEHGRAKDVFLDTTKDVHAWFYAAADYFSWAQFCPDGFVPGILPDVTCEYPPWAWDPGVMPNFVVEATLYMGSLGEYGQGASDPPPIHEAVTNGQAKVIAHGATDPQDLQTGLPGSPNSQEFDVNLGKPLVDVVPKDQDIFLVYSWYEQGPNGKMGLSMQPAPSMKPWAGEQYPVRFTVPVKNPVDVELVIPQFIHDKALIHGVLSSPWGSYDVDVGTVQLELRDPSGQYLSPEHITRAGDYSVAHGAHFKPVNITWVWDYKADHARPGTYKALVKGCDREAICSSTEATFTINADGSPGDFTVGRSGQQTVSAGQLAGLTGQPPTEGSFHPANAGTHATPGLPFVALLAVLALVALRRR
ncbi:MAG: hypothetical protein LC624_07330 [Halobacteriales archaeon]|nr:hypothetical protein [Halobacteriales archaeon]